MAEHRLTYRFAPGTVPTAHGWRWMALCALLVLLSMIALAVAATLKDPDAASLWQSVLYGALVGWLLAAARQPAWRAALAFALMALGYILLFPGGLVFNVLSTRQELVRLGAALIAHQGHGDIDVAALLRMFGDLYAAAATILGRVADWIRGLLLGQLVFDPAASVLVWQALFLSMAGWAGWIMGAKGSLLSAALPSVLLGVGTLGYAGRMSFAVYLVLGAMLWTLAVVQQGKRQRQWAENRVAYPAEKGRQIVTIALLTTAGLVLLSGMLSSISVKRIQEWLAERQKPAAQQDNHLAASLGILSGATAVPDAMTAARSPGLPRDRLLGSGPELSRRVVMTVAVRDGGSSSQGMPRSLYWRSYTYDAYTGQGWSSSAVERRQYPPGQAIETYDPTHSVLIEQDFYPVEDLGGLFYAAGEPVRADVRLEGAWRSPEDLFGLGLESSSPYRVTSAVPLVSESVLRAAGQQYPDWVKTRFLSLPESLPGRVKVLAAQLTASKSSPYDRARALESYLRQYPYTLDVKRPSVNQDVVDYFLFDLKKGYCDYYASAMVVLARASGVPARLAVGYASGTYNLNSQRYMVTEADAHSWVEVYFPDVGWVPFEPTASRPSLEDAGGPLPEAAAHSPAAAGPPRPAVLPARCGAILVAALGLAVLSIFGWMALDGLRFRRLSPRQRAAEIYLRMRRLGHILQVEAHPGDTPYEYAAAVATRLREMQVRARQQSCVLRLILDVDQIADRIVNSGFRPLPVQDSDILSDWQSVARRLWLARLWDHWGAVMDRWSNPSSNGPERQLE